MTRFALLAFLLLTATSAQAAETLQFSLELELNGCVEIGNRHNCADSDERTKTTIDIPLVCTEEGQEPCEFSVGRFEKEYTLHWEDRGEARRVKVYAIVDKLLRTTRGVPIYNFSITMHNVGATEEDEMRNTSFSVTDFRSFDSTHVSTKAERKPLEEGKVQTLWASGYVSDFILSSK